MTSRLPRIAAWMCLALVVFITLSPIQMRPISGAPVQLERFAAFAVLGFLFAIAYPKRLLTVGMLMLVSAAGLELLQLFGIGRHGRGADMLAKCLGGLAGVLLGWILLGAHAAWRSNPR